MAAHLCETGKADRIGPEGKIGGMDCTRAMLEQARRKLARYRWGRVASGREARRGEWNPESQEDFGTRHFPSSHFFLQLFLGHLHLAHPRLLLHRCDISAGRL